MRRPEDEVIPDEPLDALVEVPDRAVRGRRPARRAGPTSASTCRRSAASRSSRATRRSTSRAAFRPATRRQGPADRGEPSPGRPDRPPLSEPRPAAARPHRGGQPRPHARRREVRARARHALLDLCHLVDSSRHRARARQSGADDPTARPRGGPAGPLRQGARSTDPGAGPSADAGGDGRRHAHQRRAGAGAGGNPPVAGVARRARGPEDTPL